MGLFDKATMLNEGDFFTNNFGYPSGSLTEQLAKDYYLNICALVNENYVGGITPSDIETRLDTEEKKFLFLTAQGKQLVYDLTSGRGAMLRGENGQYNVCPDTIARLKMAGLWRPVRSI